jgi:hypothetical protein
MDMKVALGSDDKTTEDLSRRLLLWEYGSLFVSLELNSIKKFKTVTYPLNLFILGRVSVGVGTSLCSI